MSTGLVHVHSASKKHVNKIMERDLNLALTWLKVLASGPLWLSPQ